MKEAFEVVTLCNPLKQFHDQLIVVGCDIGFGVDDCNFLKLRRRNLVVSGFGGDTQAVEPQTQLRA